jgi:hypothetical protein
VPLKILCGLREYSGGLRVAALRGKAATFFLYFNKRFQAFQHGRKY